MPLPRNPVRLLATLLALGCLVAACGSAPAPAGLVLVVPTPDGSYQIDETDDPYYRPNFFDFGLVPNGDVVQHTFHIRNDELEPVVFQRLNASCGCTVPEVSYLDESGERVFGRKRPGPNGLIEIPPGAVADVLVRVDTERIRTKNTDKLNSVRLVSSSQVTPYVTLEVHVIAEQPFQVVPSTLRLGAIAVGGGGEAAVEIVRSPGKTSSLNSIASVDEGIAAVLESKPGTPNHWILNATATPPLKLGRQTFEVAIDVLDELGNPTAPLIVEGSYEGLRDLSFEPGRLHAGVVEAGVSTQASTELVCNLPGLRTRIESATIDGKHKDHLRVEWTPLSSDALGRSDRWRVTLHVSEELPQVSSFQGTVRLELDDEQYPVVELPYVGFGSSTDDA